MQFDMPDATEVAEACGIIVHKCSSPLRTRTLRCGPRTDGSSRIRITARVLDESMLADVLGALHHAVTLRTRGQSDFSR